MMSSRRVRGAVAAVTAAATLGCYTYTPVENGPPDAGEEVRVTIEGSGFDGEPRQRSYRGRLVRFGPDTLVLETRRTTTPGTAPTVASSERIRLPSSRVSRVERQRLSGWRTAAFLGGGAVGAGLILAALAGEFSQSEGDNLGDEDTTEQVLIPLFRIP